LSAGSREREASQGSAAATSARSLARALERDLAGSAAGGGASTRQRERKGGEKKAAAASQWSVERRRAVERSAFMGRSAGGVAGAVAAADAAAAGAAAIFERTEAEWEGRVFGLFRSGDKAFFTFF
jgi:hypothetical protein